MWVNDVSSVVLSVGEKEQDSKRERTEIGWEQDYMKIIYFTQAIEADGVTDGVTNQRTMFLKDI